MELYSEVRVTVVAVAALETVVVWPWIYVNGCLLTISCCAHRATAHVNVGPTSIVGEYASEGDWPDLRLP